MREPSPAPSLATANLSVRETPTWTRGMKPMTDVVRSTVSVMLGVAELALSRAHGWTTCALLHGRSRLHHLSGGRAAMAAVGHPHGIVVTQLSLVLSLGLLLRMLLTLQDHLPYTKLELVGMIVEPFADHLTESHRRVGRHDVRILIDMRFEVAPEPHARRNGDAQLLRHLRRKRSREHCLLLHSLRELVHNIGCQLL